MIGQLINPYIIIGQWLTHLQLNNSHILTPIPSNQTRQCTLTLILKILILILSNQNNPRTQTLIQIIQCILTPMLINLFYHNKEVECSQEEIR